MSAVPVGIDAIGVYAPPFVLPLDRLAAARGVPVEKIHQGLGAREMAVAPPWEDAVTLAANAAARPIAAGVLHPEEIGLLLVATETAVDHAKPIGIFLHELLGLGPSCRTVELKHACYGGTAGLMLASSWLQSGAARGRKALVVATDIARYDLESSAEFTQGAGAAALVVATSPRLLELHPATGVYARNVYDFWRPLDRREALVDGKFSVSCYLDALDGALADHRAIAGAAPAPLVETLAALLYHAPFPKMAYKAHARLVAHEWSRAGRPAAPLEALTERTYADLVEPSLGAARRLGNTYTASLYLSLAWLAEREAARLTGRDVGLFSYGSGCCAEFFTGRFAPESAAMAAHVGLAELLETRRTLGVDEYETFRSLGAEAGGAAFGGGAFRFAGEYNYKRRYERQASAA